MERRKATRIAIQKYDQPISQSAFTLSYTIDKIMNSPSILNDGNERLNILYIFGCFFGWIQIFLDESFSEGITIPGRLKNYRNMAKYQYYLSELFMGISYDSFNDRSIFPEVVRNISIPRHALNVIGELMIDKSDKTNNAYKKVISIVDFVKNYQESNDFKRWFIYLDNILSDIHKSKSNAQWNMLALINIYIILFSHRRFVKISILPSGWFLCSLKSVFSKILWFPNKIIKWLTAIRILINSYRFDKGYFKQFVEMLTNQRKKDIRLISMRMEKIVIETDSYHLKYETLKIKPGYSDPISNYIGKNGIKRAFVERLVTYLDERFLNENIFFILKFTLRGMGYVDIIKRYYEEDLFYLQDLTSRTQIKLESIDLSSKDSIKNSDSNSNKARIKKEAKTILSRLGINK